jgi:hypothetical protein
VDGQLVIPAAITATATITEGPAKKAKKKPKKKRALGGPVFAGETYLVGEQGPEVFTAQQNGTILRNGSMGNVNITINGAVDPEGTRRQLERLFQSSARRTGAVNFTGAVL